MTAERPAVRFTPEAEARLGQYLREVRSAVAKSGDVSPDEIEADIREHVETEFAAAVRPVGELELEGVLVRLGPPDQWLPGGNSARPVREAVLERARVLKDRGRQAARGFWDVVYRGPDDWRLPYLTFAVFAVGVVAFPLFPLCLAVSYLLARATMALAKEKGFDLGAARKWLTYPPAVVVSLPLLLAVTFAVPAAATAGAGEMSEHAARRIWERVRGHPPQVWRGGATVPALVGPDERLVLAIPLPPMPAAAALTVFAGVGAAAAWWLILGGIGWRWPGLPRAVFAPLLGGWEERHGRRVFTLATITLLIWGGFAYRLATAADVFGDDPPAGVPAAATMR